MHTLTHMVAVHVTDLCLVHMPRCKLNFRDMLISDTASYVFTIYFRCSVGCYVFLFK